MLTAVISPTSTPLPRVLSVDEFKARVLAEPEDVLLREVLLADDAKHVSFDNRQFIARRVSEAYQVEQTEVSLWIVGSAKLGFSITEKRTRDGVALPMFRPFRGDSDIDVAIISPRIFALIWDDLSRHASYTPAMPWNSGRLGDYLVHGWLRPDFFPRTNLRRCDAWWDTFRGLSALSRFGRRKVRGGLFNSHDDLNRYQARSLSECKRNLELET